MSGTGSVAKTAVSTIGSFVAQAASQGAAAVTGAVQTVAQSASTAASQQSTGEARQSSNVFADSVWSETGRVIGGAAAAAQKFASSSFNNMARLNQDATNAALKAQGTREAGAAASAGINSIVAAMGDIGSAIAQAKKAAGAGKASGAGGPGAAGGDCPNCGGNQVAQNDRDGQWGRHGAYREDAPIMS